VLYKADSPRSPLAKGNKKLSLIDEKEGVFRSSPSDLEILWSHQVLVQQFISWLNAAGIAPLTMKSYGATLGRFCEFLKHYHGKEITMDDIVGVNITDVRAFLADHQSRIQCPMFVRIKNLLSIYHRPRSHIVLVFAIITPATITANISQTVGWCSIGSINAGTGCGGSLGGMA
jgi:hypothetical protein